MAETDTTYTPPEMLSEMDDEAIHARMMDALPADIDNTNLSLKRIHEAVYFAPSRCIQILQ